VCPDSTPRTRVQGKRGAPRVRTFPVGAVRACPLRAEPWFRAGIRRSRVPACGPPRRVLTSLAAALGSYRLSPVRLVALLSAEVMEPAPDLDFSWLCTPRVPFLQKPSRLPPFFKVNQLVPW